MEKNGRSCETCFQLSLWFCRISVLVPLINCATSFFSGFVIFIILGHMAHITGVSVDKVISQGEQRSDLPFLQFLSYISKNFSLLSFCVNATEKLNDDATGNKMF